MEYNVLVWFRWYASGEIEKDFDTHKVEADNEPEAKRKALELYKERKVIPYKTEII